MERRRGKKKEETKEIKRRMNHTMLPLSGCQSFWWLGTSSNTAAPLRSAATSSSGTRESDCTKTNQKKREKGRGEGRMGRDETEERERGESTCQTPVMLETSQFSFPSEARNFSSSSAYVISDVSTAGISTCVY